jgi:hypothetical protein
MIVGDNFERFRFARTARTVLMCGLCATIGSAWGCTKQLPVVMDNAQKQAGSGATAPVHRETTSKAGSSADSSSGSAGKPASTNGDAAGDSAMTTDTGTANGGQSAAASGDAGTGSSAPSSSSGTAGSAGAMTQQPPANVVQACVGHAGENVCDGTTLHHCGDMGSSTQHDLCTSATRCQAGISSGKCGVCEPNDYQCTDATPEACNAMGQWEMQKPCASAALCMAGMSKHSCDPGKCEAGKFDCSGGLLRKCKDDLSDWDQGMSCDAELCDMMAGKCNECKPGSMAMCTDPMTVGGCSMDGKKTSMKCSGNTSHCLNGKCGQCAMDSDCMAANDCQTATCDMGSGMCKTTNKPAHSSCKLGGNSSASCDYLGNCLACVDDSDCKDPATQCNTLLGCVQRAPLQVTPGLAGFYSVTIAPGLTMTAVDSSAGACAGHMVSIGTSGGVNCTIGGNCPPIKAAATAKALTATILGPGNNLCPVFPLSGSSVTVSFATKMGMTDANGFPQPAPCDCSVTLSAM